MATPLPSSPLLQQTLRIVPRRYRLEALASASPDTQEVYPSVTLAIVIEQAREAIARDQSPDPALKQLFVNALARLIHDAMRQDSGDPVFQAMVLRHQTPHVREYASLAAHAERDRRQVHSTINTIAHPARQQQTPPGPVRDAMARLHTYAASGSWAALLSATHHLLATPEITQAPSFLRGLAQLRDSPALKHLQRLDTLAGDEQVRHYQSLWDRNGPRSGSRAATQQGASSRERGVAMEALAARALEALARRLNQVESTAAPYRVVTSMRVPASLPGDPDRAKSEWDVVLLRQADTPGAPPVWDVCLLVEAKASIEAATTDLPRLLRGIRLLAHADPAADYPFETRQGTVHLSGASLSALATDDASLVDTVLYCCDAPVETTPRLLGAASRMQLLSAPASLAFASALVNDSPARPHDLEPVWHDLWASPKWRAVRQQYPMLRQVRELMVHPDDLLAALDGLPGTPAG